MTYNSCGNTIFCKAPPFVGLLSVVLVTVCCLHATSASKDILQDLKKQGKPEAIDFQGIRSFNNVSADRSKEGENKTHGFRGMQLKVDPAERWIGQSQNFIELRENRKLRWREKSMAAKDTRSLAKTKFNTSNKNEETNTHISLSKSPSSTLSETNFLRALPHMSNRKHRFQMPIESNKRSKNSDNARRKHFKDRKRRSPAWMMNMHMVLCETGLNPNCRVNNSSYGTNEY